MKTTATQKDTTIDRPEWHSNAETYPENIPAENAAVHIGMYLGWIISNRLEGATHKEDSPTDLHAVRKRQMTGRDFLSEKCDDFFMMEDLGPEAQSFTEFYYKESYFKDLTSAWAEEGKSPYEIEDTWENYERVADILSKAYKEWKAPSIIKAYKHWWQFWK